jgi:hypothetical protein
MNYYFLILCHDEESSFLLVFDNPRKEKNGKALAQALFAKTI